MFLQVYCTYTAYYIDLLMSKKINTWRLIMSKPMSPKDNAANIPNANKGTKGVNKQYSQNQGNRGKQLNPNQKGK